MVLLWENGRIDIVNIINKWGPVLEWIDTAPIRAAEAIMYIVELEKTIAYIMTNSVEQNKKIYVFAVDGSYLYMIAKNPVEGKNF